MSAEWQTQSPESWKITLPCTMAESEAIAVNDDPLPGFDPPPVVMTSEPDPDKPNDWRLDVYCEGEPSPALVTAARALVADSGVAPLIERIEDADWVTRSQAFLEPIRAGRFYVHTAAHAADIPVDATAFHIEAGRAFGTGHHETTAGCLQLLDDLAVEGRDYRSIADIGTGTGLLAFAARALWPGARFLASDIDPISIDVTRENMAANAIPDEAIALVVADGVNDPGIVAAAPFDLLIANILAGPLIQLAPDFAKMVASGGAVMLAGLLASQESLVLEAFAAQGFGPDRRHQRGDWPALLLVHGQ